MSRTRITAVALVLLATVAALVAAVAGASGSATPTTMTLVGVELPKSEMYVDNGRKGDSPGDVIIFSERLHRGTRSGPAVGRVEVTCMSHGPRTGRCAGTLVLAGGTIEAAGLLVYGRPVTRLPVVGGTKSYAGTRGELTFTDVGATASRYVVTLSD